MSNEKRKVSTDALETLGTLIDENAKRDAIHLAVEPVIAGETLLSGQRIGIVNGVATKKTDTILGIVDPFLADGVALKGERFWLIVLPRTITSLRHVWSHPAFAEVKAEVKPPHDAKMESEKWLRNFCATSDCPSYERVIAEAVDADGEDSLFFEGHDAHGDIPNEFWEHIEMVTGKKISNPPAYFSCSC